MKTDDLIQALSADTARQRRSPDVLLAFALAASVATAGAMLLLTIGVRADFMTVLYTLRFPFKFVVTVSVVLTAAIVFRRSLFPVASRHPHALLLLAGPLVLGLGVAAELSALPPEAWAMASRGKNALLCLTVIPALGVVPLALMLRTLQLAAPTRPVFSGFCAGILAGAIAATFYAAHCTDDSPLFMATWYPIAVGMLGAAGALLGRFVARW